MSRILEALRKEALTDGGAFSETKFYGTQYSADIVSKFTNIAHLEAMNLVLALKVLLEDRCDVVK